MMNVEKFQVRIKKRLQNSEKGPKFMKLMNMEVPQEAPHKRKRTVFSVQAINMLSAL